MNRLLAGSVAGLTASLPMLAVMEGTDRLRPAADRPRHLPPRQITMGVAEKMGVKHHLGEPSRLAATFAAHLGYGAAAGALYGPLARRIPLPPVVKGVGYGLAVWAAGYLGWLPAAGLQPPVTRRPAGRNAALIASHVVWGAVLGTLAARLQDNP